MAPAGYGGSGEHHVDPQTFRMPVYVTRRSGAAPQSVYKHTRVNAQSAQLREGDNTFRGWTTKRPGRSTSASRCPTSVLSRPRLRWQGTR